MHQYTQAADFLLSQYAAAGFHFIRICPRDGRPSKAPTARGWNRPASPENAGGYTADHAQAADWLADGCNLGIALAPSRILSLDLDDLTEARRVFAEIGLPLDDWLTDPGRLEIESGKPNKGKLLFRLPDDFTAPPSRKLVFGAGKDSITVFELRHASRDGATLQDLLPPSIHPDTGQPYRLHGDPSRIPLLPPELAGLWRTWPDAALKSFDPHWTPPADLPPRQRPPANERDPIAEFNASHDLADLLRANGYTTRNGRRWLRPGSESGVPGLVLFDGRTTKICYSHGGDELADGKAHDAFDVYRILECQGDMAQALGWNPDITDHNRAQYRQERQDRRPSAVDALPDDPGPDPNCPPPQPTEVMFYGLVGDVARAAAAGTEVNQVGAAGSFMSWLSSQFGRDLYYPIGNTRHHVRLFTCHVGRSGCGRKGDSSSLTHCIRRALEERNPALLGGYHDGGLSSREGLALFVHDGYTAGKLEVPPIDDKRFWIIESEFANVLHQARRDGNTLSAALRDLWDGQSIRPATKSARIWATHPHIALHVAITPSELLDMITNRDVSNGFLNRFLLVWAERSRLVPVPKPTPQATVSALAEHTAAVIRFAKGDYPTSTDTRQMRLSPAALGVWEDAYRREFCQPEATDTLTGLCERLAAYAIRLGMLFAVTDCSTVIEEHHLRAALAWAQYARQSTRYVFSTARDMADAEAADTHARAIVEFLRARTDGASRTELYVDCFSKKVAAPKIDAALNKLLAELPAVITATAKPRADGRPGRGSLRYAAVDRGAI